MQIGIFAKTFVHPTLPSVLDEIAAHDIRCVQFNLSCVGLPTLPESVDPRVCDMVRGELARRGMTMAAVSGTFNLIHPDAGARRAGLARLNVLAGACHSLGTSVITLCTGTRDPDNMWRAHPENNAPAAWDDLTRAMEQALTIAEEHNVTLAVEPEVANVVDSAGKARRLLDQMGSPRLKVVMDAANLFHAGQLPRMREVLEEALDLVGGEIILAHAKDVSRDGEAGHEAAGAGLLDYDCYLSLLRRAGYDGPLILHGLAPAQVAGCVAFLKAKLAPLAASDAAGKGGGN